MELLLAPEFGFPQQWLPDETLFSLCSRYHRASGNRLASTTCRALFGHPNQGSAHDFPARLNHFSAATGTALGSVAQIVEHHTILPFYLRFASDALVEQVITAAAENSAGRLKFQLGLLTSGLRANHPLKACPRCMQEDEKNFITAYWHRQHQFPGVWMCLRHQCSLFSSDLKSNGIARFQWVLPSWSQLQMSEAVPPSPSVLRLGSLAASVGTREGLQLRPEVLSQAFRAELSRRGLLKGATQRLRHEAAGSNYLEFVNPLLFVEQLSAMPASLSTACIDITRQIGSKCSGVHPLRRLALAAWLFRDLDELLAQCLAIANGTACNDQARQAPNRPASPTPRRLELQQQFISRLTTEKSLSAAAHATGIDVTTALAWAASQGIHAARRPKILKPDLRTQLISMLREGIAKKEAAEFARVSVQTITTILRTEVGLHEAWKQATYLRTQRSNRSQWQQALAVMALSGLKAARMANPAVYAWLYRNDRDWLSTMNLTASKPAKKLHSARADWEARDKELSVMVQKAALELSAELQFGKLKLFQLYQKIPSLRVKLHKLDRLPLTRATIYRLIGKARPACAFS